MARIGIYGGSFNPPHIGHVQAAREVISLLDLDKLFIIPAAMPPHKTLPDGTPSAEDRLTLCRLAFAKIDKAEVSDIEINRSGVSYTVDTVKELITQYPDDEFFLLMGTDMLLSFENWYCPDEIAKHVTLAVMHRYDNDAKLDQTVRETVSRLETKLHAKVVCVENHPIETSSTEVRNLIVMDCLEGLLPADTVDFIRKKGYYLHGIDRKALPFGELKEASLSLHNPKRIPHVIGCCDTAQMLAETYGADTTDAARAGILHDVTKALSDRAQLLLCDRYDIALTPSERENGKLLHAKTGAAVAKYIFGENDRVCDAIYWHTTGKADMTLLEKIIYIADYMEPNREFPGVEVLRELVWEDLDAALLEGFRMSLELLRSRGKVIDPNSLQAWEYLAKERNSFT